MSIEKKSLINTLKATKKANVVKEDLSHAGSASAGVKAPFRVAAKVNATARAAGTVKTLTRVAGRKKLTARPLTSKM
ncbi:MAG TPA: hypothetical protein VEI54_10910 [Candidatus Limnocylindrales bacterium]|nr:hypothetical protein [Candidatus Limnocylindrales bacterium]